MVGKIKFIKRKINLFNITSVNVFTNASMCQFAFKRIRQDGNLNMTLMNGKHKHVFDFH